MLNIKSKGSITVETAIILPIFIVCILTIGYLMKYIMLQENIIFHVVNESKKVSMKAYILETNPFAPIFIEEKLRKENPHIKYIETSNYKYLYKNQMLDNLIKYQVEYWMDINLPIQLYKGFSGKETVIFRGFRGRHYYKETISYESMQRDEESIKVYVFPDNGERYHKISCPHIKVFPIQVILTNNIESVYRPCSLCESETAEGGSIVYYFIKSGEAYHFGDCPTINKYIIEMEKEIAKEKGYTPCKSCGG